MIKFNYRELINNLHYVRGEAQEIDQQLILLALSIRTTDRQRLLESDKFYFILHIQIACLPLINRLFLSYVMRIASRSITEIDMKNIIKRAFIWFAIYELDITIKGQTACLELVSSPLLQFRIEIARSNARRERTRLRGEYESTFPVGTRRTWTLV